MKPEPSARPFVLINMAMTADGRIATANRAVSSFGSERDHEHLLELRATADAVMCGARTVESSVVTLGLTLSRLIPKPSAQSEEVCGPGLRRNHSATRAWVVWACLSSRARSLGRSCRLGM